MNLPQNTFHNPLDLANADQIFIDLDSKKQILHPHRHILMGLHHILTEQIDLTGLQTPLLVEMMHKMSDTCSSVFIQVQTR